MAMSQGACLLDQHIAVDIRFLHAIVKEGAENGLLWHADVYHMTNTLFHAH
jgi:hypothetical protein